MPVKHCEASSKAQKFVDYVKISYREFYKCVYYYNNVNKLYPIKQETTPQEAIKIHSAKKIFNSFIYSPKQQLFVTHLQ